MVVQRLSFRKSQRQAWGLLRFRLALFGNQVVRHSLVGYGMPSDKLVVNPDNQFCQPAIRGVGQPMSDACVKVEVSKLRVNHGEKRLA